MAVVPSEPEAVAANSSAGAAAGAAPAPLRAPPVLEEPDAARGATTDETVDVHAGWVELVERIRSEKTVMIPLTQVY